MSSVRMMLAPAPNEYRTKMNQNAAEVIRRMRVKNQAQCLDCSPGAIAFDCRYFDKDHDEKTMEQVLLGRLEE